MKTLSITESEYLEYRNDNLGYCPKCGGINDSFHEPDAENYTCDECGSKSSHGIENCLIMGYVNIKG